VIIGEGKQSNELKSLCKDLQVKVEFLGKIENLKLPKEIQKSELFVLPSSLEGHPKALIEAMACGCAVIGADVPGIRNIIQDQENGLLCPPTVDGIQNAVARLITDDNLREKLGKNAAMFAADNFSLKKVANLEIQAIMDCLSKSKTGDKHS
jgi:glycosyltransferase involved in cell wall biosynthesis